MKVTLVNKDGVEKLKEKLCHNHKMTTIEFTVNLEKNHVHGNHAVRNGEVTCLDS